MKWKTFLSFAAALLLHLPLFSQNNPLINYLPGDVSMVVNFDVKRLAGNIPRETFRESFIYRELIMDSKISFQPFLAQPERSGIDLSSGILLAIKEKDPGETGSGPLIYIFGKLRDAGLFTTNIQELVKESDDSIAVYGTDRILFSENNITAAWNHDIFVISSGYASEIRDEINKAYNFDDSSDREPVDMKLIMEKIKRSQRDICFQLLTSKPQNKFHSNSHFTTVMNSGADIKIWNGGAAYPMPAILSPFTELAGKLKAFTGKNNTALVNFENGKIVVQSRSFPEATVTSIYNKYPSLSQHQDLVHRLPKGTIMGMMNISFSQEMTRELLEKAGLGEIIDSFKRAVPFDLHLATGVFKSYMMLAVVKTDITNTTDPITSKMGGFQVIVALPVADKVKFEKLKATILPHWDSLKTLKAGMFKDASFFAKNNEELLVLSLSPETATAFLNNPGTQVMPAWLDTNNSYPLIMNVNIRELIKTLNNKPVRSRDMQEENLFNMFDQLIVYGGKYENESINNTIEFSFTNQTENALKQLFDLVNAKSEISELLKEERKMQIDSVITEEKRQEEKSKNPPPAKPPNSKVKMQKFTPPVIKKE
ncbi:MAG: hypothetical protein H7Y01_00375 [Ferruginibacter sp.]|nr:hypothetical protein [Chitinophagaceae bacterium]